MKLVLATRNSHKVAEFATMLGTHHIVGLPLDVVLPPEDGDTFAENALDKARTAVQMTGTAAIADDSGIEAIALAGRPGVRSARFAGEDATDTENRELLARLVPAGSALAYVCALAFVSLAGREHVVFGRCTGTVASTPRGTRGFGYDPIFVPDDRTDGLTMAEITADEKAAISHRGRAAAALVQWLAAYEGRAEIATDEG